jgi:hypothetical protein
MAANLEITHIRRQSFAPLIALLVLAGAIATTYVVTRPETSEVPASTTSFGLGRDALVAAGYTGRLGGATLGGWRPAAHPADITPRVGSTVSLSSDGWMASAIEAGFTGRLGATAIDLTWMDRAIEAGFTGRLGATFDQPSDPPYVSHQRV